MPRTGAKFIVDNTVRSSQQPLHLNAAVVLGLKRLLRLRDTLFEIDIIAITLVDHAGAATARIRNGKTNGTTTGNSHHLNPNRSASTSLNYAVRSTKRAEVVPVLFRKIDDLRLIETLRNVEQLYIVGIHIEIELSSRL